MRRRLIVLAALACGVLGLTLTGCGPMREATRELSASFTLGGEAANVEVVSSNGRVTVLGVDGQTSVEVTATLRSYGDTLADAARRVAQIDVEMAQEGDRVELRYDASAHPLDVRLFSSVDFLVTVPVQANVDASTSNGRIEGRNLSGVLELETSNGRIEATDVIADLDARTSNGVIHVEHSGGLFALKTSNGAIEMESVDGVVDAETSNGEITYSGYLTPESDHRMVTSNGAITLAIRSDASLIIDAETSQSSIVSTLPLIGDTEGTKWDAVLNPPATGTLTLRTSNGRIEMHGIF
jgi:hypothetical protein